MQIKFYIRNILIAIILVLTAFGLNRIFLPCYEDRFQQPVRLEVTATGEQNPEALSNNVRLAGITVNGNHIDLSQVTLENGWEYSEIDDFLYIYDAVDSSSISLDLEDVTTLKLTFVSEVGSGIAEIRINGEPWKTVDLFRNTKWSESEFVYDTSVFVHPEAHFTLYMLAFAVFLIMLHFLFLLNRGMTRFRVVRFAKNTFFNGILALILYMFLCFIQYESPDRLIQFFSHGYLIVLESYLVIFLTLNALFYMLRSRWLSFAFLSIALEVLLTVSSVKIMTRGLPLLPWDLAIADTALSVAGNYDITLPMISVAVLIATLVLIVALFHCRSRLFRLRAIPYLTMCVISFSLLGFYLTHTVMDQTSQTNGNRVYQVGDYYEQNGFVLSFLEYTNYLKPLDPPDGYNRENLEHLQEEIGRYESSQKKPQGTSKLPNIVVVMSESFWDITRLDGVTFEEDPLPNYRRLAKECTSGTLLSHVYGGNTVISEFEFLTGFHASFFPTDYMVYGNQLRDQFFSAVKVLGDQGYYTIGMHPYIATNYNRNVAYEHFGFDKTIFEDDFSDQDFRIRNYISDRAMFERIESEFELYESQSDQPFFLFGITMQNHGGYWEKSLYRPAQVEFEAPGYQDTTVACMNDYFAGLHASDEAFGDLISYFEKVDEDTIVIFFGDHMADAGTKEEKMLQKQPWYHAETFATDYETHLVPYLVWNNFDLEVDLEPCMDIGLMLPSILKETDVYLPEFWRYLESTRKILPAFNKAIAILPDGTICSREDVPAEQQAIIDSYGLLSYDYVWGQHYVSDLWDPS